MKDGFVRDVDLPGGPEQWGCTGLDNNCGEPALDGCPECLVAHCDVHLSQDHDADCSRKDTPRTTEGTNG